MNTWSLGRNDPCPSGCGKKYKRCHGDEHQKQRRPVVTFDTSVDAESDRVPSAVNLEPMRRVILERRGDRRDAMLDRMLETTDQMIAYQQRLPDIEKAFEMLNEHEAEFDALWNDQEALIQRACDVFGGERFANLRFQAADVQRAFEKVGFPGLASDPKTTETIRQAILFLADEGWRSNAVMVLLMTLPDYVQAGRFTDGLLVATCAQMTHEDKDESNAFMFQMFHYGINAWEEQRRQTASALMGNFGVDIERLRGLPVAQAQDEINAILSDPQKRDQIESFINAHPETRAALEAECQRVDELSIALLHRDDTEMLLPTCDVCVPWLDELGKRIMADPVLGDGIEGGKAATEKERQQLAGLIFSVSEEMARAIFTPVRVVQLRSQIADFAAQRKSAGDAEGESQALAALVVMARETADPVPDYLSTICYIALRRILRAIKQANAK